jgi:hypothetical protein
VLSTNPLDHLGLELSVPAALRLKFAEQILNPISNLKIFANLVDQQLKFTVMGAVANLKVFSPLRRYFKRDLFRVNLLSHVSSYLLDTAQCQTVHFFRVRSPF